MTRTAELVREWRSRAEGLRSHTTGTRRRASRRSWLRAIRLRILDYLVARYGRAEREPGGFGYDRPPASPAPSQPVSKPAGRAGRPRRSRTVLAGAPAGVSRAPVTSASPRPRAFVAPSQGAGRPIRSRREMRRLLEDIHRMVSGPTGRTCD